jgi:hypothetical protein
MNASDLAARMLEWEETQRKADALRSEIEAVVLEMGKTQTVGNVRASYSAGRKSYDYEQGWRLHGYGTGIDIEQFRQVKYDYSAACKAAGIDVVPYTQSEPSVSVKLVG